MPRTMIDAAVLPATLPDCDVVAGYLSSPGTLYGWRPEAWSRAKAHARYFLPIWVAAANQDAIAGAAAGKSAANEANDLRVPHGCAVVLDCEQGRVAALLKSGYCQAWRDAVAAAGFHPVGYTSRTSAAKLAKVMDVWVADWGKPPEVPTGYVAIQYANDVPPGVDLSVVADTLPLAPSNPSESPMPGASSSPALFTAPTHTGEGYWRVTVDGHVYAFGDAPYLHSPDDPHVAHKPVCGVSAHPRAYGYWITCEDGGVFAYGAAKYHGTVIDGQVKNPA